MSAIDYTDWTLDGIFYRIPPEIYYQLDRASQSTLKIHKDGQTLQHMRDAMLQPFESTDTQKRGEALHALILEPEEFDNRVVVGLDHDRRSNKNKEAWAEFEAAHADFVILTPKLFDDVRYMGDAARAHEGVKLLLEESGEIHCEATALWPETFVIADSEDERMVCPCKARLDILAPEIMTVGDLKTTTNASQPAFRRAIRNYGYHYQAGFYNRAARRYFPQMCRHVWIVCENVRPYCCAVYEMDEFGLEVSAKALYESMRAAASGYHTNNWTAYSPQIERIELGDWALYD